MRYSLLVAVAALAVGPSAYAQKSAPKRTDTKVAPQPAPASLSVFSFLGDDTETPTQRTELNGSKCTATGTQLDCMDFRDPKIGGADLKWMQLTYNNGLLYRVLASTWTNRYSALLDAFTAKYGTPRIEVKKWQAKSGATFDNSVATWTFKGGELELSSLGTDLDSALFTFVSTINSPPREKPKIDF